MNTASARLFNAAVGASAVSAAFELGLLKEVHEKGSVDVAGFAAREGLEAHCVAAVVHALVCVEVLQETDGVATPGVAFQETYGDKGYFLWLTRGYGTLLKDLASLIRDHQCTTTGIGRDGKYIAMAGRDYGSLYVDSHFLEVLDQEPVSVVADFGCGSAERLIGLARSRPGLRGVGVEVNPGAVELARGSVAEAGLEERLRIVHSDVKQLVPQPEFADVEVIFCFFMGHDLWPRERCRKVLEDIQTAFPKVRRFLLCDTWRSAVEDPADTPIFTLGFEFSHALMGQYIPTDQDWMEVFEESGWTCAGRREVDIPYSTIFDLRPRRDAGDASSQAQD